MRYAKLGKFTRDLRIMAGLSQKDVSNHFKWKSSQLISNTERGISHIPFGSYKSLAKLYSVDYQWLRGKVTDYLVEAYVEDLESKI